MSAIMEDIHKAKYEYPYLDIGYNFDNGFLHFHEETEVLYVYEGSIIATIGAENHLLSAGDICIILPSQIHTLTPVGPIKIHVMKLYPVINLINIQLKMNIYHANDPHYAYLFENISNIIAEDIQKKLGFELAVVNSCGNIMLYILRNLPQKALDSMSPKKAKHYANFITKVNSYLDDHYQTTLSLEDISMHFNYSRSYFSRFFKEVTGQNFIDYYTVFKLKKSILQLKSTHANIESIALSAGFNNLRSYNRAFQKHFGQSREITESSLINSTGASPPS